MAAITGKNTRALLESRIASHGEEDGRRWYYGHLQEAYAAGRAGTPGGLRKGDIRIREVFEAFAPGGADILRSWMNPKRRDQYNYHPQTVQAVMEGAGGASIGYSDF